MERVELFKNIFVIYDFITEEECDILLNECLQSKDSDWQEINYAHADSIKQGSELYEKYQNYKKQWDKTSMTSANINILENIRNRCHDFLDKDLNITDEIFRIKKFTKSRSLDVHHDDAGDFSLRHGLVIYLNDDYDGGEIYYPEFNFQYKPVARSLIIHPANKQYRHGIRQVSRNDRYSISCFSSTITNEFRKKIAENKAKHQK